MGRGKREVISGIKDEEASLARDEVKEKE